MADHSSHAGHMAVSGDRKALVISGVLTGIYFVVELGIGIWTGSVAVTSDAFHTFSAVGGVLIALVAQRLGERGATPTHTFGWGRAEILGALFNGIFLFVMAGYVIWMGATRLQDPIELGTTPMLLAASGGIVTEVISFWLLYRRQKGNLNMKCAFWHILQTFVGSLIVVISALVIRFTGFLEIDPLLGILFGFVLFWASWRIMSASLRILLQSTPEGFDLDATIRALRGIDGVSDVHHVHAWSLASGKNVLSGHIIVRDFSSDGERVLKQAGELLKRDHDIYFSTLQVESRRASVEEGAEEIDVSQIE